MFSINNYSYKNSLFFKYLERFGFRELTFKRQSRILVFLIILPFFRMIKYYLTVHIKTMTKYYLSIFITVFFKKKIHTNACGDFTLTCRKTWLDLNGYYEFQGYSWHLDSIFLFKALNNKKKFIDLKYKIYHINQTDKASGYIAGKDYLFKKLIKNKINFIGDKKLKEILNTFKKNPKFLDNNKWGFKNKNFNEYKYF